MSLLVIGLNHRTAPVALRERLAFSSSRVEELLPQLKKTGSLDELVILSTCNRTEFYISAENPATSVATLNQWLHQEAGGPALEPHLYRREEDETVSHLFKVAAGLDSMVIGEHEILGQVKNAYLLSHQTGCTGKLMNVLFQRSLYVGKRVRTETGLSLGSASIGSVAVGMAERIFGDLHDRTVMILGAGKMAELTAKYLLSQKVRSVLVSNRTYERAQELAKQFGGHALHFEQGLEHMDEADIVICSTAAPHPIIQPDQVKAVMQRRKGRSLFFIDIAVPRDVHPDVHQIDNVYLYNIDDLQTIVKENMSKRSREVDLAESIISDKSREFSQWLKAYQSGQDHSLRHTPLPPADLLARAQSDK